MGAVAPNELLRLWNLEQITPEMAIGQLIQTQLKHQTELEAHHRALAKLQAALDGLITRTGITSRAKGKKPRL